MNSIPKFIASFVVIMIAVLICIGLIFAGIMVTTAKVHHNNMISLIEDSDFNSAEIDARVQELRSKGFAVVVTQETNSSSVEYCRVELFYNLYLPLFGKVHTGKLVGYAYPGASFYEATSEQYFEIDSNGILGIKPEFRWATDVAEYCSDSGDPAVAGSKNDLLPSKIVIPSYFDGIKVKGLCDYMFVNCLTLNEIIIDEGVTVIGDYAFRGCANINKNIVLPKTVSEIGEYAFYNCGNSGAKIYMLMTVAPTIGASAFCADNGAPSFTVYVKSEGVKSVFVNGYNYNASQCTVVVDNSIS